MAHGPARQGWASAETVILTFTHPPGSDTKESRCPSFALYYLAKGLKSLVTLGHIRVQNLELRSWVYQGLGLADSSHLPRLGRRAPEPSLLLSFKREQNG